MLIVHEERLLHGLRRDGDEGRSGLLDLRQGQIHGFHLSDAERAPAPADEVDDEAAIRQQVGGADKLAVVIRQFEFRRFCADGQDVGSETLRLEFSDRLRVDSLRFGGDVLGDQFFALGVDFA